MKALAGLADEARQGQRDLLHVMVALGDLLAHSSVIAAEGSDRKAAAKDNMAAWNSYVADVRARV